MKTIGSPGPGRAALNVYTASEIATLPPPEWLIDGVLEVGSLIMVFGDPGGGKSLLTLDMANCIVRGEPWQGAFGIDRPRRVLYLDGEGFYGQAQRQEAWELEFGFHTDDRLMYGQGVIPLYDKDHSARFAALNALVEFIIDNKIEVVVWDTLARSTVAANENSTEDMGQALDSVSYVRERVDEVRDEKLTVVFIHHAAKASGMPRGASAILANVETAVKLTQIPSPNPLGYEFSAECYKQKNGPRFPTMRFDPRVHTVLGGARTSIAPRLLGFISSSTPRVSPAERVMEFLYNEGGSFEGNSNELMQAATGTNKDTKTLKNLTETGMVRRTVEGRKVTFTLSDEGISYVSSGMTAKLEEL